MTAQLQARHWIDGKWMDAPDRVESINPATGETIGNYTEAGEVEATRAIAADPARQTCFCGLLRSPTMASSRSRSLAVT
jgi:hypothetical protein